jgi:phenylacetate-CoA ligase
VVPSPGIAARLGGLVDAVRETNPFQRARLASLDVRSAGDLRALPPTTKADLAADQAAHPPFGTNLTYPLDAYTHLHQTSGTTGRPLRLLQTAEDWRWNRACFGRVLREAGIGRADRIALAFSFGPYLQFWSSYEAAQEVGALVVPLGAMDSEQRLRTMREYAVTALVCTPTYALRLAEVAAGADLGDALASVENVLCLGEPGASIPSTRGRIEEAWSAVCHDHAGMTEVGAYAYGCAAGGLHVNEDEFVCEILASGAEQEVGPGGQGELVLTALGRTGCPAIRYRTGDVVETAPGPCPAGHEHRWLPGGIVGRTDDMVVIRGMNVFPSAIEQTLREVGVLGEYRITFYTDVDAMDEVRIQAEVEKPQVVQILQAEMRQRLGLRVRVVPVRPGILPRQELKARRVEDLRRR